MNVMAQITFKSQRESWYNMLHSGSDSYRIIKKIKTAQRMKSARPVSI